MLPVAHYPKVHPGTICWEEILKIVLIRRRIIQDLRKASDVTGQHNENAEQRRTKEEQENREASLYLNLLCPGPGSLLAYWT